MRTVRKLRKRSRPFWTGSWTLIGLWAVTKIETGMSTFRSLAVDHLGLPLRMTVPTILGSGPPQISIRLISSTQIPLPKATDLLKSFAYKSFHNAVRLKSIPHPSTPVSSPQPSQSQRPHEKLRASLMQKRDSISCIRPQPTNLPEIAHYLPPPLHDLQEPV